MNVSRRSFMQQTTAAAAFAASGVFSIERSYGNHSNPGVSYPLTVPLDVSGGTLEVTAETQEVWPGYASPILTINKSTPGPTIRVKKGERFKARVENRLAEPLVLHWHGILAPSQMDGNPRDAVLPAGGYDVDFPIDQPAGTYWYHAHTDKLTGKQVYQGLAGFFIVEDPSEDALGLPKGIFDVPLLFQDRRINPGHTLAYTPGSEDMVLGFLGDSTTVNGVPNATLSVARGLYRFRLLNASNARVLKIGLGDNAPFKLIANDAGLLSAPIQAASIFLAPGNRAEILIDFAAFPHGSTVELRSLPFPGDTTLGSSQGQPRTLMTFVGQHVEVVGTPPVSLVPLKPHNPAEAKRTRQFVLTMPDGGHAGHQAGMTADFINGLLYQMDRTDFTVPFGELEVWEFQNMADHLHPMHPHGALFQVLSRSTSQTLPPEDSGWKDTVLVRPGENVKVLIKFDVHQGAFVLHCHNLEHEDGGMMLNFDVSDATPSVLGPQLTIRREGQDIIVTSPHEASSYRLESAPSLRRDASWTTVTTPPTHTTLGIEVRLPRFGSAQFFRLVKP